MSVLDDWARAHGIGASALADLRRRLLAADPQHAAPAGVRGATPESRVIAEVRLAASSAGWRLWRNNLGAVHTVEGGFVRYGLCNESSAMNAAIKSSDLIGIRPLHVGLEHVGRTVGQFAAIECKRPGWKPGPREDAQARFLALVESLGGHGRFSTGGLG